jgi:hypothetical protein
MERWLANVRCVGAVLGARQIGKTSLLLKMRHLLQPKFSFVYADLQAIEGADEEQCFGYIAHEIRDQLDSIVSEGEAPNDGERFLQFLREFSRHSNVVRIVVVLDEVGALPQETAVKLAHTIRSAFNSRLIKTEYKRYVFILAGAREMLRLATRRNSPLKNVTESIYLGNLAFAAAQELLMVGLGEGTCKSSASGVRRIYSWTSGHPYWTQRVGEALAKSGEDLTVTAVDHAVERLLQVEDRNLPHIFRALDRCDSAAWEHLTSVLDCGRIPFTRSDPVIAEMELIGVIGNDQGRCVIRSKLYQEAIRRRLKMPKPQNTHALITGVGSYDHQRFANLPATVRDVHTLTDVLLDPDRGAYRPDCMRTITGPDATAANIRMGLARLAESTNGESTVFVYFSGHGGRALEDGHWRTYLCPREANPYDLANTAVSGDEFSAALAAIPARRLLVILDACHAGGSAQLKSGDGTTIWKYGLPENYYEALSQGSGRVVIASSKAEQYSHVRPQGDLSLFTYHLRDALIGQAAVRGDGLVHVLDVFHYVNEAVQADEPDQIPILKVKDLDLNFPIAVAPAEVSQAPKRSEVAREVETIREQIVRDPIAGAKALSRYLKNRRDMAGKRNEVDLKRTQLESIQYDLELFGPDPSKKAEKNRAVFYLLRLCLELELSHQE